MPLSGVRMSWLMRDKNSVLARLPSCACFSARRSITISETSRKVVITARVSSSRRMILVFAMIWHSPGVPWFTMPSKSTTPSSWRRRIRRFRVLGSG